MAAASVDEEWFAGLERKLVSIDGRIGLHQFKDLLSLKDVSNMEQSNPFTSTQTCFLQAFIAERFFQIFDKDGSGSLSTRELIDGVSLLTRGSKLDKLQFIFQVYDVDGQRHRFEHTTQQLTVTTAL